MQTVTLDKNKVKQVTNASRTATATMIMLGFRQRAHSATTLSSIKNQLLELNENIVSKDYMDFWRGLETAGVGSIILGRRGKQTRFEWNYSLRKIAQLAIEGKEEEIGRIASKRAKVIPVSPVDEELEIIHAAVPPKAKSLAKKEEKLVYRIPVRKDYILEISLPVDVSQDEIEKIKASLVAPT